VASLHVEGRGERCQFESEVELVLAAQRGEPEARAAVVDAFMAAIGGMARLYRGARAVSREELMQEGVVGLLRAVDRYDATLETPFWAYASWWVRQAMQHLVSELTRPVVLSDRAIRQLTRVRTAERERMQSQRGVPTLHELASDTGLPRPQIEQLIAAARAPRALDEPIRGEDESGRTLLERVSDPGAEDEYDRVPVHAEIGTLEPLLQRLNPRERMVMRARYGFDGPVRTLREIALTLGMSAERVRQIQAQALDKLRAAALGESE